MLKVMVHGCDGRMGQEVIKTISEDQDSEVICGFDKNTSNNKNFNIYNEYAQIVEKPDVIIDFTIPMASLKLLEYAKQKSIPVVIATTGFSKEEMEKIEEFSKYIPIFKSNNMSVDINLMCKIVNQVAKILYDTDAEIVETHHNRKVDSPSGTALMLADAINQARGSNMEYDLDRHNKHEKRSKNEIGISSIRGGNIVGEHSVIFFGENESFEIKHISYSRTVFAEGALKAAKFIVKKEKGVYNMENLI